MAIALPYPPLRALYFLFSGVGMQISCGIQEGWKQCICGKTLRENELTYVKVESHVR